MSPPLSTTSFAELSPGFPNEEPPPAPSRRGFFCEKWKKRPPGTNLRGPFHNEQVMDYLLALRQMFIFSASLTRPSRRSGWATLIRASARCQVDLPARSATPYSVTIRWAWVRGTVTIEPCGSMGTMRDLSLARLLVLVGGVAADEGHAAIGHVGAGSEVELSARAADVARPGRLGRNLAEEVDLDTGVDGYHVVVLAHDVGRIGVGNRVGRQRGVRSPSSHRGTGCRRQRRKRSCSCRCPSSCWSACRPCTCGSMHRRASPCGSPGP